LSQKSSFGDLKSNLKSDLNRSLAARLEIIEDQVEDRKLEQEGLEQQKLQTLISSFKLAKRVNYPLQQIPVSLYEGSVMSHYL